MECFKWFLDIPLQPRQSIVVSSITINWCLLDVVHVQDGGRRLLLVEDVLELVLGRLLLLAHLVTIL